MTGAILRYDQARRALAEARSIDEVRDWEDKAAAVREYARRSRNREMEIDAAEIRVRAQRRHGELLAEMKASGILAEGRRKLSSVSDSSSRVTLADLDTSLNESSRAQKLAALEPDAFERLAARCRERLEKEPQAHAFDVLRERDGPVNGARSVMGSRQEPDDSADFFPTPPYATRALFEHVLPRLGVREVGLVWEPACGEGHIAEVAAEYAESMISTDLYAYGYSHIVADFLRPEDYDADADWIITNPPFGDLTEKFVLRAIDRAEVGVAMFVRLQWLETVGRYETIFRDKPPTVIAFFAERVNLCKGRWEPEGSTATAYIWLVWMRDRAPVAPMWIPPGCRKDLARPDDVARFTAHPVPRGDHRGPLLPPHDPATGEIVEHQSGASDHTRPSATAEGLSRPQGGFVGGSRTDLYEEAVALVIRDRKASTSYLERRLQLNYNTALALMERMEKAGIVSAANHAGKRELIEMEPAHRTPAGINRAVPEPAHIEGGSHVTPSPLLNVLETHEDAGGGGPIAVAVPPASTSEDLKLPAFLDRSHPDCVVKVSA